MTDKQLNDGDTVRLNSGGPDMVVYEIRPMVNCLWKDEFGNTQYASFPIECLTKVVD